MITKHDGTGGLVSVGTVTAQLLYEIAEPAYLGPDVITHFDTVRVGQAGPDRVALAGTRGSPPPGSLKVALNMLGGYRNTMTLVITGLDIEQKAEHARQLLFTRLGGTGAFDQADVRLLRFDRPDAPSNEQATAHLRITVKSQDERAVGRAFSDAALELALGGYAGFYATTPPTAASAFGVYWPALVPAAEVTQTVHLPDGTAQVIPHTAGMTGLAPPGPGADAVPGAHPGPDVDTGSGRVAVPDVQPGPPASASGRVAVPDVQPGPPASASGRVAVPLGRLCGARSGDKGGNANVGFWARDERAYAWLCAELTVARLRELLTEAADLEVRRFELPNLRALNFVVIGLIAPGVAATTRPDAQAKGLGEYLRSRYVLAPAELVTQLPGGH